MSETQNAWVKRVLALDLPAAPAAAAAPERAAAAGSVNYAKSRLAWLAMRRKVDTEVEAFIASVAEQYRDEGNEEVVRGMFRNRLGPALAVLDDSLADTLDAAANEAEPGKRQALLGEARATIGRYQAYVEGEDMFAAMDENPFAPTAVRKSIMGTLQALAAALR